MLRPRIIPCLLVHKGGLVKTVGFEKPKYPGDPLNAVRIFNEKEVDELMVLDIDATQQRRAPDYTLLSKLAAECRMPLAYGGGVHSVEQFERLVGLGVEKVSISAAAVAQPALIGAAAARVGGQSVVVVLDVRRSRKARSGWEVFTHNGRTATGLDAAEFAQRAEQEGAGEIVVNSIERDGQMKGYDLELVRCIRQAVTRPLTVLGGAGTLADIAALVREFGIIGAAAGSLFVFKGVYRAVFINYPARAEKDKLLSEAAASAAPMKQILQNLKDGSTEIAEVPRPGAGRGQLLIRTTRTLVSAGTERMLVDFGKAGFIEKARQQPDKVRMVLDKVRTDGSMPTIAAVSNKLDQALPMGYCNVGEVVEVGPGVTGFEVGDRVASNGKHAEVVSVPVNLCAKVDAEVTDDEAAFTVLGAIALQGIRLVQPTLGEAVVVTGLGLIGLVTVQLLRAHGCRVLGLDFDAGKLELARRFGAQTVDLSSGADPVTAALAFSRGRGVDAVIVTAATRSSEPMHQAALMSRKRGRIVLVGVTGLELSRADFFEKELTFQVSCSYGPGRYDPTYEDKGHDYPVGFVRWTEQRNFEAVLDMLADGRLDVRPLISHRFDIGDAQQAYALVGGSGPSLGIVLRYPGADLSVASRTVKLAAGPAPAADAPTGRAAISFIGAGNYAAAVLIPAFKKTGAKLARVASNAGVSGLHVGRKFGFEETTTDTAAVFLDSAAQAVVITTRHDSHAGLTVQALRHGKHVFVEKPLCLTLGELAAIEAARDDAAAAAGAAPIVMVGFNRRFAPQVQKMKQLLAGAPGPKSFTMTVNAGAIPGNHWSQDPAVGGGRLLGEACHFIDLLRHLADAPIVSAQRFTMHAAIDDTLTIQLTFADGSIGTVNYFANGSKAFPKERLEVFAAGRVLQLDNFRRLTGFGWPGFTKLNLWRQDKGQNGCAAAFTAALGAGGAAPIPFDQIVEVARVTIQLASGPAAAFSLAAACGVNKSEATMIDGIVGAHAPT